MALRIPMNVLLDTCALIALSNGPLPAIAAASFGAATHAYVSPVSAWEAGIKFKLGKLRLPLPPQQWFQGLCHRYHLTELPLTTALLCTAAELPLHHGDPFDRVLIAAAMERNLTILTSDTTIPNYPGVRTLW
jgi:PIN domain nuclease of toxin-antitoxin system